ncbi:hypothetical protein MCELHM10_03649 [Paracoccaceae bacterium]
MTKTAQNTKTAGMTDPKEGARAQPGPKPPRNPLPYGETE